LKAFIAGSTINGRVTRVTMHTLIASRTAVALMVLMALAACAAQAPSVSPTATLGSAAPTSPSPAATSPSPAPTQTFAADCVNPPVDIMSLINVADPVACYGHAPLTFDAYSVSGVADCPVTVEPDWLACPQGSLMQVGETRKVGAPQLTVAIDPASGVSSGGNANVHVTGHFDDPAAQTCHETQRPPSVGGSPEPIADSIERCRGTFVVTQLVPIQS
jgi:hypothetical protein